MLSSDLIFYRQTVIFQWNLALKSSLKMGLRIKAAMFLRDFRERACNMIEPSASDRRGGWKLDPHCPRVQPEAVLIRGSHCLK